MYCYFDNDIKVHAPFDARTLIDKLGLAGGLFPIAWQTSPKRVKPVPLQPYRIFKPSRPS